MLPLRIERGKWILSPAVLRSTLAALSLDSAGARWFFILFESLSLCLSLHSVFVLFFFFVPPGFLFLRLYVFLSGLGMIKNHTKTRRDINQTITLESNNVI